ncbi:MAG: chromosome segregation protein [Sphingobacteriales bacterium]|jgi:chromosome segregation protein
MELKSLEIKGFKSFGDRTKINFDKGITAIVGPNGCGKSNVVDSIRWVLGEQKTRMLRSDKMENVIFNGNKTRKASNLAEVSLTFDNTKNILSTDYSTVTITRKYYRTGDSEYRLNDVQCRLKDITDLFIDTGIGSDSYAIIELGMVDEILNNKDNARRTLVEEAAGVSKYKIRKKQTHSKLNDTEKDLERVEDLLFELEGQLKILEKQAKKTKRYYELKEEYKVLSTQLAALKVSSFKEKYSTLEKDKAILSEKKMGLVASMNLLEANLQKLKLDVVTKEKNLGIQQKTLNDHLGKIRQYEGDKKVQNERQKFLSQREENLGIQLTNDKGQEEHVSRRISELNEIKVSEDKTLLELQSKVESLKTKTENATTELTTSLEILEKSRTEFQKQKDNIFQVKKELEINDIQLSTITSELAQTSEETSERQVELQDFSTTLKNLEKEIEIKKEVIENLVKQETINSELIEKKQLDLENLDKTLVEENRVLDSTENEYNLTKSLVDNLEGFPESIKFLKKSGKWTKDAPLLSDILFCEEEYRVAIENYLESYMNYYVVENFEEASNAINLLSDSSRGRANFFILNAFDGAEKDKKSTCPENCISVLDVVEVEEKYQGLCKHLLRNTFLVTTDEQKTIEQYAFDKDKVFLSASGKFSKTKYSASGGSVGLFEGKRIGRVKNLEKLSKQIKKAKEKQIKLKGERENLFNLLNQLRSESKKGQIEDSKEELNERKSEFTSIKARQEQYEAFIQSTQHKRESLVQKKEELIEKSTALRPELEKLELTFEKLGSDLAKIQTEYDQILATKNTLTTSFNEDNIRFHQQQNKVNGVIKDVEYFEKQQKELSTRIDSNNKLLEEVRLEIQTMVQNTDESDDELVDMYALKERLEAAVSEFEEHYYKTKGEISESEEQINAKRREKDQSDVLITEITEKVNELKLELNSMKERLSVEFGINLEDLIEGELVVEEEEEVLSEKTLKIRDRLDNFGQINPLAVEAYDEMKERSDFIIEQKQDLLDAKATLLKTIEEIDQTAKEKFMDAFIQIRNNFQEVFRSLFNPEDSCDLKLSNPDEPLESDIEIIARPKGKRPLTINQLSGGEKTLTATALLFSLYLLKPAPFCIFDEVDAPLDDTNIDKFNNIIRKFSKDSQFIIVSHNKRTIASTDIIYGVTMIEMGVSKMVPVDMRQIEAVLN